MADRFDKFTERARRVLTLAQEEAQRFNHNYIGTEHLLLGLVREGDGVAAKVLNNLGVELSKVRSAVEFIIGRGEKSISGEIGLTPRAKKVIELAVEEARRLNHSYIGTEHLLLGLVREGEGIAFGVLESLGVSLERVRTETTRILSQNAPQSAPAGGRTSTRTPTVDQLGIDLTAAARAGKLDPVIGRHREIERMIQILSRRTKNNPILVGEPGVGKTAIVEGLARRLQPIQVDEPSVEETIEILKGIRERYEEHHKLTISDEALQAAAELAARYVSDRFLPDKAIDLVDEASSHVRIRKSATPPSVQEALRGLESLRKEKDQAIGSQQYEFAAELRDRELKLQERIEKMEQGASGADAASTDE